LGGTVTSTHAQQIQSELLGVSDGTPGQRFQTHFTPILKRNPEENVIVDTGNEHYQDWQEVPDFAESEIDSLHYTLDSVTGELRFGPAIRQQDGTIKLFGAIPHKGSKLVFKRYRYGGGEMGNVQTGILNTLKTAIPYIARVTNREPAWGGLDSEPLESAKMRAPALLRSRDRAVTEADFEFLAGQAIPASIGRVKCLQPRPSEAGRVVPGQVYVLVIPRFSHPEGFIDPEKLKLKDTDIEQLSSYLDDRRMLTTRLDIRPPAFHWVSAYVELNTVASAENSKIEEEVLARLYRFLNPLTGGVHGGGWPFGRDLFVSDVYQCLQGIPMVQFIRKVDLFQANPGGERKGGTVEMIEVVAHGVIASGQHSLKFL
jgi:predicted phage baseplate assembly protein